MPTFAKAIWRQFTTPVPNACYAIPSPLILNRICLLCFIGQRPTDLPEVDQELLRLMTQWIGASIERQTIEDDRTKYRTQLGKVTRLITIGEMASGLAHEINQPMTRRHQLYQRAAYAACKKMILNRLKPA